MLGFSPLSSATLADVGSPSLPIAQISGVEATGEVTDQPMAFQPVTVAISGVSATVAGANYVDIMIGAYRTLYALNLTAELEPLPLTGLTRLMLIDSAGELNVENGIAGVPTIVQVAGVEATNAVGSPIASVSIAANLSGVAATAETTATTVIVDQNRPITGFGLAFELEDLDNAPHLQLISGFNISAETETLGNSPHLQLISGLQTLGEVEDLDNTPLVTTLSGVQILSELESLDNTSVIQVLPSVECATQLEPVDNRPGNATSISGVQATGQTEEVAIAHDSSVVISGTEATISAGNVIVTIAQRRTILGVQAVQELSNLESIFVAFPISIGVGGVQAVTAVGTVQLIEVVRVPFAKSLPAGLSNFVFLKPSNANSAIVDNKINRLG